jgi:hypothetical protein
MWRATTRIASSGSSRVGIAILLSVLTSQPGAMARQALKTGVGKAGLEHQAQLAAGGFQTVDEALTPCVASWPFPFHRERRRETPWIGRFVVETMAPGAWSLVVKSLDGDRPPWRAPLTAVQAPGAAPLSTDLFPVGNVAISLEVAAPSSGPCPIVVLKQELQVLRPAEQRGQVGGTDDRWAENDPRLAAHPNSAAIKSWARAVVRMDVVTPTGLMVPCTGYFITPNLLMTAAHCVSTDAGAAQTVVHLGAQRLSGAPIRLVMAQGADGDLDFSLLWIDGVTPPATLALKDATGTSLSVWQAGQPLKLVSIFECSASTFATHDIVHTCDTIGGSSGSPVQDLASGAVIGLHVVGCTSSNATASCRNGAKRAGSIRDRIRFFANELKMADPPAAAQLVSAGLLPQN